MATTSPVGRAQRTTTQGRIVDCIAYKNGERLGEIPIEDISEVLKEEGTFVWLGLHEPDEALLAKLQEEFGLHELAIEDARVAYQRPKLEEYADSLFVVLKTTQLWDDRVRLGEVHVFVGTRFIVAVCHGPVLSFEKVRERFEAVPHLLAKGPGFALYALMDYVVDDYLPIAEHFEGRFERMEATIFKGQFDRGSIERLYDLKRSLLDLRNAAAPLLDVGQQLMRFHRELIPKETRVYFRDVHDHATRIVESTDRLREMMTAALHVNLALVTVGQNEVVKRLAGWGAILAIPTVVFSLYGMNFDFMPELEWPFGYPLVLAGTLASCVVLYRRLKRAGWL
jgi:magnesium transporter